jgi:hypothetical protein
VLAAIAGPALLEETGLARLLRRWCRDWQPSLA